MVVTVTALPGLTFGAEIHGVDLRQGHHSPDDAKAVVAAWNAHRLLVIRGQALAPADEVALAKHFPFDERLDAASLKPWVPPGKEYNSLRRSALDVAPELELKGLGALNGHLGLEGDLFESNPPAEWHTDGTDQREEVGPPVYTQARFFPRC
jgi:alpha-ketoglutarate-dependent taurine dioxygenase